MPATAHRGQVKHPTPGKVRQLRAGKQAQARADAHRTPRPTPRKGWEELRRVGTMRGDFLEEETPTPHLEA